MWPFKTKQKKLLPRYEVHFHYPVLGIRRMITVEGHLSLRPGTLLFVMNEKGQIFRAISTANITEIHEAGLRSILL